MESETKNTITNNVKITIGNNDNSVEIDDNGITINSESGKLHFLNQ